jgi:folate-dependent phosphoribosylglycinamide formyltransferase PurN
MSRRPRIIVLAGPGVSTRILYHALERRFGVAKVIIEEPVPTRQLLRRRLRKLGARAVAGQVAFKLAIEPLLARRARARLDEIKREHALDDSEIPKDAVVEVSSVNAPETLGALRELLPDVVILNGTRIVAKHVLEGIASPIINMHAGITPLYRGVHGGYWALANRDPDNCGVTVHLVDAGIDTGRILGQACIHPTIADNFVTYPMLQLAEGLPLLLAAVEDLVEGRARTKPPPSGASRLWSHPTIGEYVAARIRAGVR